MRFGAVATVTMFVAAGFLTCLPGCNNLIDTRPEATATGGSSTTAITSSGGAGGTKSNGGATGAGGVTASGGITASGGKSSGGDGGTAAGGSTSLGGATGGGGSTAGGGSTGRGGSGGTTGGGGTTAAGGSTGRGGSGGTTGGGGTAAGGSTGTVTGNCTDTPPPGQTPTCAEWNSYGMCAQSWFATYCNRTCGRCSGSGEGGIVSAGGNTGRGGATGSGGVTSTGGTTSSGGTTAKGGAGGGGGVVGPGTTNPQISGTQGWASRYWDCCKPSCGWTANSNPPVPSCQKDGTTRTSADSKNGCEGGGSAYECYDFSPWYDSSTNMAYGFAAYNGVPCGTCFMLQFNGNGNSGANPGASALKGQQMVVQVINIGGIQANQFDLLIPGGGVGAMTAGCTAQWGNVDLGVTYGGLLSECGGDCTCMKGKCSSVFGNLGSALKAGCDWFTGWFSCADNPQLAYKQVSCPSQLTNKTGLSK